MIRRLLLLFLVSTAEQVSAELSPTKLVGDFVFLRNLTKNHRKITFLHLSGKKCFEILQCGGTIISKKEPLSKGLIVLTKKEILAHLNGTPLMNSIRSGTLEQI